MNAGLIKDDSKTEIAEPATSSKHRFRTHVVWTLAARCVTVISGTGVGIIVARWLGPPGLGEFAAINITILIALQVGSMGLPSASTYFVAQDSRRARPILANSLSFVFPMGLAVALAVCLLAIFLPRVFGSIPPKLMTVAAVSIPFQLMTVLGLNILLGLGRVGYFNLLDAGGQSIVLFNTLAALVILHKELLTLVTLNTLTTAAVSFIIVWIIHRMVHEVGTRRTLRPDSQLFTEMARYGLKFHISIIAAFMIIRADLLIVNHFRGAAEAGVYAVASQAGNLMMLLPTVIGTLLMPRVAARFAEAAEITMRTTRHTVFLMLIVCALAVPASFLLPILYGRGFADSILLLLILLPGVFLVSIESVLVHYFSGTGLPLAIPLFWSICLAINMTLNFVFVPEYGAWAAALSSSITYAMIFVMVAVLFRLRTGSTIGSTFLLRDYELRGLLTTARSTLAWRWKE